MSQVYTTIKFEKRGWIGLWCRGIHNNQVEEERTDIQGQHRKKKSCHSVVICTYDFRMTIFLIVIAEGIRTYDIAMTNSAIVD